ncbi:MAG: hypothetical protein L6Q54_06535 [Leptospiraceae bacterium]|nr:hypothetical protein [Leptospiraceae bacterium]MCK6380893.1 hypothetical protein [Leptospiraceae bacterium]NUM40053.1 hypothetical protein [Leptospiraceae bacterium]
MEEEPLYEEKKTPAGFLVKVRLAKMTYVVFTSRGPEIPKGSKNNSIIVPVPRIVFLGEDFDLSHFHTGELSFVSVKAGKMVIPYQHGGSKEVKTIFLNSGSGSDILPIIIYHFKKTQDFIVGSELNNEFHHLVIDEDFPRQEMVSLKIRFPTLNILIIKRKIVAQAKDSSAENSVTTEKDVVNSDKVRATDIIASGSNLNMYSENPVFLARIHLRNMELDKVRQILLDFKLTQEDVVFIRTFLTVMLKNENNKEELRANKEKIQILDEIFRLAILIFQKEVLEFEVELDKGFSKEVANMIYALLEKSQEETTNEEDGIMFWEWKYRTKRMVAA